MIYSKEALDAFTHKNKYVFLYNQLLLTRSAYYCQWVIMTAPDGGTSAPLLFRPRNYYAVPSSAFPTYELQSLIINKVVLPCPPVYDNVIKVMEWWGRGISGTWQQRVFHLLHDSLNENESMTWLTYAIQLCGKVCAKGPFFSLIYSWIKVNVANH